MQPEQPAGSWQAPSCFFAHVSWRLSKLQLTFNLPIAKGVKLMKQRAFSSCSSTLLDAEETTGLSLDPSDYRSIRIHPVRVEYAAAYELYSHIADTTGTDRTGNLEDCRTWAWFVRDTESGLVHVASNSCKLRWCPVCARARTYWIQTQVLEFAQNQRNLRILTLTLRHTSQELSKQIDYLYSCFRRLRKYKQFKKLVTGGLWFFQVTYNSSTGYWHPHIHCLITGFYIPKSWLIKAWTRVTKGSFICDIKLVRNHEQVAKYVARYCARPIDLKDFPLELRVLIYESFHGRRLAGTWGKARTVSLSPRQSLQENKFVKLGSWSLVYHSKDSDPNALMIYRAWKEKTILLETVSMMDTEEFINGKDLQNEIDDYRPRQVQSQFW